MHIHPKGLRLLKVKWHSCDFPLLEPLFTVSLPTIPQKSSTGNRVMGLLLHIYVADGK